MKSDISRRYLLSTIPCYNMHLYVVNLLALQSVESVSSLRLVGTQLGGFSQLLVDKRDWLSGYGNWLCLCLVLGEVRQGPILFVSIFSRF
jgi:hypothetical protein